MMPTFVQACVPYLLISEMMPTFVQICVPYLLVPVLRLSGLWPGYVKDPFHSIKDDVKEEDKDGSEEDRQDNDEDHWTHHQAAPQVVSDWRVFLLAVSSDSDPHVHYIDQMAAKFGSAFRISIRIEHDKKELLSKIKVTTY